jgi:hypothetical protein
MTGEIYPDPACECGAQLDEGQTRCRKCRARDRWRKRLQGKRKRRGESRRPPRDPRNSDKRRVVGS